MKECRIKIIGMHCVACESTIKNKLLSLNGVKDVNVSLALEEAKILYDEKIINLKDIIKEIQKLGYDVYKEEFYIKLRNFDTIDDERIIKEKISGEKGVIDVETFHALKLIKVTINPNETSLDEIISKLKAMGYEVLEIKRELEEEVEKKVYLKEINFYKTRFLISFVCLIPIAILSYTKLYIAYKEIILFILTSIIMFFSASRLIKSAIISFRNLSPNMDSLVILGTGTAYIYSTLDLFLLKTGNIFFEASAFVITIILLGRYIESRLRVKTFDAIRELSKLIPKNVRVLENNKEKIKRFNEVKIRDIVLVKEGETIPVDGIILDGYGEVDESTITGESKPVVKKKRDPVISGTIVRSGFLKIVATRVGKDTTLSQMIKYVKESSIKKPSVQKYIDKIVGKFTWIVIMVATLTFFIWKFLIGIETYKAVLFTSAVLVISCPCALGLASPLVYLVAINKSLRNGILVRNPEVFELIRQIGYAFFDKTGTITHGRQEISIIKTYGQREEDVLRYAAIAESRSNHTIARVIVEEAKKRNLYNGEEPKFFETFLGMGVYAKYNGHEILVGNEKLMKMFDIDTSFIVNDLKEIRKKGVTVILISIDGKISGIIGLTDKIRNDIKDIVKFLKDKNIKLIILSGDNEIIVKKVAEELGFNEFYAEVSPEDKAKIIERYQDKAKVMMVGDGINDSPALIKADVGIAVSKATDVAKASGDIILLKDDLKLIRSFFKLSEKTLRKIKFNIFYAFLYNTLLIPIAAGALYPTIFIRPEIAGTAMALSSISVTINSLLLKFER